MITTLMTVETIFTLALQFQRSVYIFLGVIPVVVFAASFLHGVYDGREPPWRHFYALVVHGMTAILSVFGAFSVYHILEIGSGAIGRDWMIIAGAFLLSWLIVLIVVKRAVDFSMIRSVRNPFALLLSWIIGWTAAWFVDAYDLLAIVPVTRVVLLAGVAFVTFFIVRVLFSILNRLRS